MNKFWEWLKNRNDKQKSARGRIYSPTTHLVTPPPGASIVYKSKFQLQKEYIAPDGAICFISGVVSLTEAAIHVKFDYTVNILLFDIIKFIFSNETIRRRADRLHLNGNAFGVVFDSDKQKNGQLVDKAIYNEAMIDDYNILKTFKTENYENVIYDKGYSGKLVDLYRISLSLKNKIDANWMDEDMTSKEAVYKNSGWTIPK